MNCKRCRYERQADPRGVSCDITGLCIHPGEPGTTGALWPENRDVADSWKVWKALGYLDTDGLRQDRSDSEMSEIIYLIYSLEIENRQLRRDFTFKDETTGKVTMTILPWDNQ